MKIKVQPKGPSFQNMSRQAQLKYLEEHPNTRYTTADVKTDNMTDTEQELYDKLVARESENTDTDTELDKELDVEGSELEESSDDSEDTDEVPESEEQEDTEPEPLNLAKPQGTPDVDKQEKIIDSMDNVVVVAESRKKNIAKLVAANVKEKASSGLNYIKNLGKPQKEDPDSEDSGQSNAKLIAGSIMGAILLVGAGAALMAGAAPLVAILAEEFIANKEWMSESSAEAYEEDIQGLVMSALVFLKNIDPEDIKELLENYNAEKASR